jgi:hypothetical protein
LVRDKLTEGYTLLYFDIPFIGQSEVSGSVKFIGVYYALLGSDRESKRV